MTKKFAFEMPKSLTEIVTERVREAIIDGEFQLGELISEEKLAESFGVSRTPVRDALTQLQSTGLVEIKPKRGSYVFLPNEADVVAVCDFRLMLELQALERAHSLNKNALITDLETVMTEMDTALADKDIPRYGRCDIRYHDLFFAHCGNSYLGTAYTLISGRVATLRTTLSKQFSNAHTHSMQ